LNNQTVFLTAEAYAVDAFKVTGRTVMVTRSGDAPTEEMRVYDEKRDIDLIIKVAGQSEIDELNRIPEMRKRFQILESVPYTDIIIGHEVPTAAQNALRKKRKEDLINAARVTGSVILWLGQMAVVAGYYAVVVVLTVATSVLCGEDPVVWARLPDSSWLEVARYYE
jgi:hypothetical protein